MVKLTKYVAITLMTAFLVSSCNRPATSPNNPPSQNPSSLPSQPPANPPQEPNSGIDLKTMEQVYAPVLYFDSQEKNYLTSVDAFIEMGVKLQGRKRIKSVKTIKERITSQDLVENTLKKILIEGDEHEVMLNSNNQVTKFDKAIYTRKYPKNDSTVIQYWFFYSYNDTSGIGGNGLIHKCGNHQGDWEHISLKVNNKKFEVAMTEKDYLNSIEEIYFSQHNKGQNDDRKLKKVTDKDVSFEGTHIKAYPARGTHATYYKPHEGNGYHLVSILGIKLYDKADGKGTVFNTENSLYNLNSLLWSRFAGKWGVISDDICNLAEWFSDASNDGPLGPFQKENSGMDL